MSLMSFAADLGKKFNMPGKDVRKQAISVLMRPPPAPPARQRPAPRDHRNTLDPDYSSASIPVVEKAKAIRQAGNTFRIAKESIADVPVEFDMDEARVS